MEAFSYEQHHPFLASSAYHPSTPLEIPLLPHQVEEPTLSSSYFPYYYAEPTPQVSAIDDPKSYDSSSSLDSSRKVQTSSEKKRKNCQPKGTKEGKNGKQKNNQCDGLMGEVETNSKVDDLEPTKSCEDYIHVRAKRGQATDSHSLAERVRREKISERMKMLQGLVPGCEKVTGKALVLDEIINYVQSLQIQVEFLSMKLGALNPILYEYGDCINQQEDMGSIAQPMPSVIQASSHIQPPAYQPTMDSSFASFLLQGQGSPSATFSHDSQSFLVQIGDQRQVLLNHAELMNSVYSLHQ